MKKKVYFSMMAAALLFSTQNAVAQNDSEANTLFGGNSSFNSEDLGFFLGANYGITQMDGFNTSLLHLRSGLSLKDKFTIGAYFSTAINEIRPQSELIPNLYMDYWTVGGFVEYTLFSDKIFHLTTPVYFGYGEVEMDLENGPALLGEAKFLQIEPVALLEVNLHKFVRFNIGAGYRFVSQMDYRNFNQSDISGLTAYVGLKFGLFR